MAPSFPGPLPVQCGGGRRPGSLSRCCSGLFQVGGLLANASPTAPDKKHFKRCSTHTTTFLNNNALSNSLHNNLLLNGINTSPGWLLMTRTRGAWWCLGQFKQKTFVKVCNKYSKIARQKNKQKNLKNAQLTKHDAFLYWSSSCPMWMVGDGQDVWRMLLWTVPRRRTSRLGQYWQKTFLNVFSHTTTFPDNNALSNSLRNNLFLDGFNTSPGWLLVTRTRGAWWCRYRGHCRSGPRHLSPRSRVCAQEWHWKDIHSHIHSHTPMHTPKKVQKQQQQNAQLTKHDAFVYWSSSCAMCWWPIFRKLGTCSTTDALSATTLLTENICESVQQILQLSPAEKKK